jgi:hypothetical protein
MGVVVKSAYCLHIAEEHKFVTMIAGKGQQQNY